MQTEAGSGARYYGLGNARRFRVVALRLAVSMELGRSPGVGNLVGRGADQLPDAPIPRSSELTVHFP